ncbi:hypothetical protein QK741_sSgp2 [Coredo virus]|uniref:Uncharacterized protein n=1 Tax=Coredo virus TaxID=2689366 RepID=A0A6B9KU57_9VIRU|nr:hypothetical protein QK741_sSgp2 [Coredo virus]QHA33847.1 hypothetical protein [Coredo virus]
MNVNKEILKKAVAAVPVSIPCIKHPGYCRFMEALLRVPRCDCVKTIRKYKHADHHQYKESGHCIDCFQIAYNYNMLSVKLSFQKLFRKDSCKKFHKYVTEELAKNPKDWNLCLPLMLVAYGSTIGLRTMCANIAGCVLTYEAVNFHVMYFHSGGTLVDEEPGVGSSSDKDDGLVTELPPDIMSEVDEAQ